jgi:Na+-driven multidrug efflux pump
MLATPSIPFTPFNLLLGSTGLWWLILILDSLFTSGVVWLLFRLEDKLTASEEEEKNG